MLFEIGLFRQKKKRKERKKNKKKTKQNYNIPIPISSALLCLRGSRNPRRRNLDVKDRDLEIEKGQAGLPWPQQL